MSETHRWHNHLGSTTGHVVQAHTITGDVHFHASRESHPVPRQLPAPPTGFTNRIAEISELSAQFGAGPRAPGRVAVISGPGGIGKTAFALHWAHHHRNWFPDGQLFVDLCGFDPNATPAAPKSVVRGFLHALGASANDLTSDVNAQVGLYRSLLAERRMLIVLDNAFDTGQIVPLRQSE